MLTEQSLPDGTGLLQRETRYLFPSFAQFVSFVVVQFIELSFRVFCVFRGFQKSRSMSSTFWARASRSTFVISLLVTVNW